MQLIFIGTGSAFTTENFQSNTVVRRNGKNLLIDAGGDIRWSLKKYNMSHRDVDAVYVTHLHSDHTGGLEYLAFASYFDPSTEEKIQLIANNELICDLWSSTLQGGLRSIQGKRTTLVDFFDVSAVRKNGRFTWEDIEFRIVQSVHIMDGFAIVPSFGLMFTCPETGKVVFHTGDTQFNPNQIVDFYRMADLIVHDCETCAGRTGVHARYDELVTLPAEIKRKMVFTHYQDNVLKDIEAWEKKSMDDGFGTFGDIRGFLRPGTFFDTTVAWPREQ